ncbi:putative gustatory receptor 89a [Drosophila hydei]|uniref:Gustatory receptor n=1 Tax=Drosophila hydei TaxID=7224 RepID=A0A6J1LWZ7_DROHY|nr:putative gustatory receptor 89a [Drosophila hydei]
MPRLPHFGALCLLLLVRLWQALGLAPLSFSCGRGARCRRLLTASAWLHWLGLLALSPLLLRQSLAMYEATNVKHSTLFKHIALATMAGDVAISLALLFAHIWQRQRLARLLNGLARLQRRHSLSWPATLLMWAKLLLSLYELLCNVPFLQQNAARLPWLQLLAYGIQLYVQHMSSVFGNGVFCALLLLLGSMQQLEWQWQQPAAGQQRRLLRREQRLLLVCADFVGVLQLGIFLLVIGNFINILANMYAYMSYFVEQHGIPLTISNYCAIVAIQLYALILATQMCQVQHAKLRRRCLELCYVPQQLTLEQAVLPTPLLMWPLDNLKFPILGLFNLDNAFWLFLVSYAVNFIVIILQFTVENIKR